MKEKVNVTGVPETIVEYRISSITDAGIMNRLCVLQVLDF